MLLEPQYAQNIIVGVIFQGEWQWYVTDKELWFLDLVKLSNAFKSKGYDMDDDNSERFGIRFLNEQTAELFLSHIQEYKVEVDDLRQKVLETCSSSEKCDCILDMCPVLHIDFDNRILFSMYPEPASYEDYVPDGWVGKFYDFTNKIPNKQKYWLINGEDYFKENSNKNE